MQSYSTLVSWLCGVLLFSFAQSATAQSGRRDDMTYFQDGTAPNSGPLTSTTGLSGSALASSVTAYVYRLQPGDVLAIAVSSLNADADANFNPFARAGFVLSAGGGGSQDNNLPIGYRVSETGTINFPQLGLMPVVGKTLQDLERMLRDTLTKRELLTQPYVAARLLNFKISVLGEVNRPSVYTVQNEKITLTEAISLAGDLTVFGKRQNVLVTRENAGQREFIRVDLTQRSAFSSPAYYLKPNDVIYVEPKSSKRAQASRTLPYIPTILGAVTLLATVFLNIFD